MNSLWSTLFSRIRPVWRTLRFRLAFWNALAVSCISLLILVCVHQGVQWALMHEVDQVLLEDIEEISLAIHAIAPSQFFTLEQELQRKAQGHKQHGWFVELLDRNGDEVWISQETPHFELKSPRESRSGPYSMGSFRVVERGITSPQTAISLIRVGATLDLVKRDMAHLDRLVALATLGLLIISPVCGYWLAGRAARTVGEIIDTASRLRPSHLEERLALRGTGDELDQLSNTINHLLDRIAAYLEQKRDFLANAAHELRTPLAAIRSSVEVALTGNLEGEDYETLLADVIDQTSSLETLVNQLLLLSETETDQWKHRQERVPLAEVVSRAVDMFQGVAEARGIVIRISELDSPEVVGSRRHLRQVINNLIDNAVKYTPDGGRIDVSLHQDKAARRATLTIRDTGIGIALGDIPHVYDRFFRSDRSRNRDGAPQGTGLGLSICQAVVNAHGGTISCRSELNVGTVMEVTLPLATGEAVTELSWEEGGMEQVLKS